MTTELPPPQPQDPVLRDDQLLDAISRGEPVPSEHPVDDPIAALLHRWHSEVEAQARQLDAVGDRVPGPAPTAGPPPAQVPAEGAGARRPVPTRPGRAGRPPAARPVGAPGRRRRVTAAGVALALVGVAGGLWLGAVRAEPGGLLWPVTRLVYADRAESLATEREIGRAIEQARRDLTDGRHAEAREHLERAAALLGTIGDGDAAARLRSELDDLRRHLPPVVPADPTQPGPRAVTDVPASSVPQPPTSTGQDTGAADPAPASTPAQPESEDRPANPSGRTPAPADRIPPHPTPANRPADPSGRTRAPAPPAPAPPAPAPPAPGQDRPREPAAETGPHPPRNPRPPGTIPPPRSAGAPPAGAPRSDPPRSGPDGHELGGHELGGRDERTGRPRAS
ncbi:anti-sigma-D factor RsdA [Micromonospora sp. NPDC094482]|uniref:anti-sigma-D factor RsdA n=1 Tax=unclassified Micromonospora TaxID=2617518 RepID=UPI00332B3206